MAVVVDVFKNFNKQENMATGKRLLTNSMSSNYKQGTLYPVSSGGRDEKKYGNSRKKKVGIIRKMGQSKVRKQLKKDLKVELTEIFE